MTIDSSGDEGSIVVYCYTVIWWPNDSIIDYGAGSDGSGVGEEGGIDIYWNWWLIDDGVTLIIDVDQWWRHCWNCSIVDLIWYELTSDDGILCGVVLSIVIDRYW